jgi:hypothetical protein
MKSSRRLWITLAALAILAALSGRAAAIQIGPGVALVPWDGTAEYRFAVNMSFSSIHIGAEELRLGAAGLNFSSESASLAISLLVVDPRATDHAACEWTANRTQDSTAWFNVTRGLIAGATYTLYQNETTALLLVQADTQGAVAGNVSGWTNGTEFGWVVDPASIPQIVIGTGDLLIVGLLIFAFIFLVLFGILARGAEGPVALVLAGVVGIFLALEAWNLTAFLPLTIILGAIGTLILIFGVGELLS